MKIAYYRGEHPNFGDELNLWLWPKLLPDFFDDDGKVVFIGIGSTIGFKYDLSAKKIVFGAAYYPNYYDQKNIDCTDWDIYFVRGPRTAHLLNISPELAIGDSAILIRTLADKWHRSSEVVSFIPHWESLGHGSWERVCALANINLIDPRRPVDDVLAELLRSRLVIAEAMHGAIVADALRIPWVPLLPINGIHRNKWFDWTEALGIQLQQHRLWPSNLTEMQIALERYPKLRRCARYAESIPTFGVSEQAIHHLSAYRLTKLAQTAPCLSDDRIIESATGKMLEKLSQLRRNYGA
jgi:Polysaccharide pyruvyl transferase